LISKSRILLLAFKALGQPRYLIYVQKYHIGNLVFSFFVFVFVTLGESSGMWLCHHPHALDGPRWRGRHPQALDGEVVILRP